MLIYTIDDEQNALEELNFSVTEALPNAQLKVFSRGVQALEALKKEEQKPEIVFSDIRMPGIDGLELAARIKVASPDTLVIFVTGYSDYALKAFKVHADGYLMKPVLPEHIREEINNLQHRLPQQEDRLFIMCFGNFEVFWDSKPLSFKRKKSKELLAYLIDREGASCTAEEIINALWENVDNISNAKHKLRNLISDLKAVLSEINRDNIILRGSGWIAVDRKAVFCDYYKMLEGDMQWVNSFKGEYMKQYSWAELTLANLAIRSLD